MKLVPKDLKLVPQRIISLMVLWRCGGAPAAGSLIRTGLEGAPGAKLTAQVCRHRSSLKKEASVWRPRDSTGWLQTRVVWRCPGGGGGGGMLFFFK